MGYFTRATFHYREREKGINQYILIYCTEGCGWYELNGIQRNVSPDDFFIISARLPHRYGTDANDPWSIYWVHFGGSKAEDLDSDLFTN